MKKFLTSFVALSLIASSGFAVDRNGYDSARSGVIFGGGYRAPTLPVPVTSNPVSTAPAPVQVPNAAPAAAQPAIAYSIEDCMNDLGSCVANTLPEGINSMFNSDMRNSVVNGMGLCGVQIDKCINNTSRTDGKKAYYARNDVWIDFNSRVIQPQYYSFVLTKTGLTPNQAENTCWLLDRNVYGSSFTAVDAKGSVTSEYNKNVQSYNGQGGANTKGNPMGAGVNTNGLVDAQRGHYARWDATKGECLVRVAAYNKDDLITNEWFGGIGDKQPAEVWKKAGESFSCEKDTFGFGLNNNTKTAALASGIGIVGGAAVGAGVGALVTHNQYEESKI
jgi:hypothetical protein